MAFAAPSWSVVARPRACTPASRAPTLYCRSTLLPRPRRAVLPRIPRMCAPGTGIYAPGTSPSDVRVVVFGATGYIGRFVVREFARQGYSVIAFTRERSGVRAKDAPDDVRRALGDGVRVVVGDLFDDASLASAFASAPTAATTTASSAVSAPAAVAATGTDARGDGGGRVHAPAHTVVVSCLASRTGGVRDSNRIDYEATARVLRAARAAGSRHFVLLSAICVQRPLLEFQRAKLRFEAELEKEAAKSGEDFSYSIVRPTAFFKSLAAQVDRMKKGGSYVMFGDGKLCKCNALSEADLARFMVLCAKDPAKRNAVLPVGGPGTAVTPKDQADIVFRALGRKPKYWSVPIGIMDGAISILSGLSKIFPAFEDPAEFGRIGKYYATEDMVGPQFGKDTLEAFFEKAVQDGGMEGQDLGDAAYF